MEHQKWSLGFISLALLFITSSSAEFLIQQVTEGRGTEYNSSYRLGENPEVTRELRDEPPSSKILSFETFSVVQYRPEPYESSIFESSGYKWRLVLYFIGNRNDGGNSHVSLYVKIEDTASLPKGWEVNVDLKLFIHKKDVQKYLTVTDGTVKQYNAAKKEWGFAQMIPLTTFYNQTEGYIVEDTASFGAEICVVGGEICVVKPAEQQEKVTFISNIPDNIITWKIRHFSTLEDKNYYYSDEFLVGDRYWRMGFNPKGAAGTRDYLPLYLFGEGFEPDAVATTTWVAVNMRLRNHLSPNGKKLYYAALYPLRTGTAFGTDRMIKFTELYNASNGYLVDDSIIFAAEFFTVSVTNIVSA